MQEKPQARRFSLNLGPFPHGRVSVFVTPGMTPGPGDCSNQSRDRNAEQRTKEKKIGSEDHVAGDKFPIPATSQRQGPGLIFYKTSGKITSLHNPAYGVRVEVITNSILSV